MRNIVYETLKNRIVSGIVGAATKTTSPIKRWLHVYDLPQNVSIKFGRVYEEALNDLIVQSTEYEALTNSVAKTFITPDGKLTNVAKGNKDVDVLFKKNNTVYYREVKCNLLLDSEKSKATASKVVDISSRLQKLFPGCEIDAALLNMDWCGAKTNLHGVRIEYAGEFINRLGLNTICEKEYLDIGKNIGYYYKEGVNVY